MEAVTKITVKEAIRMYYRSKKFIKEELDKARKLVFYNLILVGIITGAMLLMPSTTAYAEGSEPDNVFFGTKGYSIKPKVQSSKPIQQFPKDVINLATAWREIPKTAYKIKQDEGTIPGFTLGPIKGTTTMVKNVSKGIWQALNSDNDQEESEGLVFSYKF